MLSKMMTADILREKFLAFFKAKKHKIIESDSLVPQDDPTVLFTPAGMNQFKKEFMGLPSGLKRAATCQRCLRTDDLEKVGKTSVHHTFFEMLGNFSFGDYFKKEAIVWAWEFLTVELKISADKFWVSVYEDDAQAFDIWTDLVGISPDKIIRLGDKNNFWPAEAKTKGPNGPCGPCSEIFFDFGKETGCKKPDCTPACGCARFAEVWNLVFTQFNRMPDGSLESLPSKNIDTGMGLERLAAVIQGKENNFQTDLFEPITRKIKSEINKAKGAVDSSLVNAISDHLRAITFSIYDGVSPANEGRGYVVRKMIRKSLLHLRSQGIKKPYLYSLVSLVALIMRKPYFDLSNQAENIAEIVLAEEKNFIHTLDSSEKIFKSKFAQFAQTADPQAAGKAAFLLHDTYGIPLELTCQWLEKQKIGFSQKAFAQAMQEQQLRSRLGSAMKGDVFGAQVLEIKAKETKFVGYEDCIAKAKVLKIFKGQAEVSKAGCGEEVSIILDLTPFYAESGGQVGDSGQLAKGKNIFLVKDTQKAGKVIVHRGIIKSGSFKVGDALQAQVEAARRMAIARNHTATHILQAALREILGAQLKQQGSLVEAERLRFDFTHFKGLDKEQLERIEEVVNKYITSKAAVNKKEMSLALAKKTGALAFFGEKYPEAVRVVSIGNFSKEFCGGTHLDSTGQIGLFKITRESSIAQGVRRIEAVTADFAKQFIKSQGQKVLDEQEKKNKLERDKELEKQQGAQRDRSLRELIPGAIKKSIQIKDINIIISLEDNLDMRALCLMADIIKEQSKQTVIVLGSQDELSQRAFLVVSITADLLCRSLDAGVLIRQIAPIIGGEGGGRKDFAQAGGRKPENFTLAFEKLRAIIKNYVGDV